jgi:hypothetical protein
VQVELVVGRQGEDRDRMPHAGAIEPLIAVRPGTDVNGADAFDRASKVGVPAPEDDDAMPLQGAELLGRTQRDRTATDDDQDRIVGFSHRALPHPSVSSGSGGYACLRPAPSSMIHPLHERLGETAQGFIGTLP